MIKDIIVGLLGNPVTWGVLLAAVFVIISWVVYRTKTQKDDQIWHMVTGIAVNAFNIAEKFIPDGSGGTLGKLDVALKTFTEEYRKRTGKAPNENVLDWAKDEWSILAHELKKK